MGKQCEAIINHFSHPHPLHLITHQTNTNTTCSACKHTSIEPIYTCKTPSCTTTTTSFSLHLKCSQLPNRITHPCHHHHHNQPLSLLLKPQTNHPNGVFACNACGKHGDGFLYSCKDCNINIHVMCATLPLYVSHPSHCHQLSLVFLPPYGNNGFSCDVCGVNCGSFCWLYRCVSCGFDAHLSCATSKVQVVPQVVNNGGGRSMINNGPENLFLNQFNNQKDQYLQAIMGGISGSNNVNNQILQGMFGGGGNGSNPVLQAMLGGGGGGSNPLLQAFGGGGGDPVLQAMLGGGGGGGSNPLLQAFGGGGGDPVLQAMLGGGGGGGGSNPLLQAFSGGGGGDPVLQAMLGGGGGGGGNPLLQAFMGGGGGGGGGDLVQSILNGSGGGVGGLDLSSVLGGGGDLGGLMGAGLGGFGF